MRELGVLAVVCRFHLDAWRGRAREVASCARGKRQPGARDGGSGSAGGRWGRSLERRRVVARVWRLVDVVAVGVAAKRIVVARDDTGHGRGRRGVESGCVPVGLQRLAVHVCVEGASLVSVYGSEPVVLLDHEIGRGVVERRPLRGAVGDGGGCWRPCKGWWCKVHDEL